MSTWIGNPAGKGGAAGTGNRLQPVCVSIGDVIEVEAGSGYDFGEGGANATHAFFLEQFPSATAGFPTGADPVFGSIPLSETNGIGQYDVAAIATGLLATIQQTYTFAGAAAAGPNLAVFDQGPDGVTRAIVDAAIFTVQPAYYLVGVVTLGTPGDITTFQDLIDYQVVYVHPTSRPVFSGTAGGVDTTALLRALHMAGHNVKVVEPTANAGILASRRWRSFDDTLNVSSTPALATLDDLTNVTSTIDVTMTSTPDSLYNVQQESTKDT